MYIIGCDPELFVFDGFADQYISAHDLIKGTKEEPFPVPYGATQVDGVAAEFNIDPCTNVKEFITNISFVKDQLSKQMWGWGYHLVAHPVATFDPDYFDSLPVEAKMLGCQPDYNAYTGDMNDPPATDQPFRTGSGHVHVGYEGWTEEDIRNRVKQLDYVLFLSSLLWDDNQKRRDLYGMPGAFRYKPYGFEYRVLSNKWVGEEELQRWVFLATVRAMELYDEGVFLFDDAPALTYDRDTLVTYHRALHIEHNVPLLPDHYLECLSKAA